MAAYIALIRKEPDSDYGVDFPDFPGCITAGRTLEEARRMAAEALELHVEGMSQDGEAIPAPSSLDEIMADEHNRDAVAFLVDVAAQAPKAVRVNVTLPEDLLEAIDRATTNRSRFLAEAARAKLREPM
jgi:predicted RNase H-like HicB family nuclease